MNLESVLQIKIFLWIIIEFGGGGVIETEIGCWEYWKLDTLSTSLSKISTSELGRGEYLCKSPFLLFVSHSANYTLIQATVHV